MGVFMVPLYDHEGTDKEWIDRELKLTGREEDLMSLMDEHEFFFMYTNDKGCDTFVVIHWDEFHIETLKEEFPEWSHEFFSMWEGHCNFMIS